MKFDIYTLLVIWNVIVFVLYGIDKWKAQNNKWRISEKTLILSAFLMGSLGAMIGMSFFRHKTKHLKFKLLLPIALFVNLGIIILVKRYLKPF